MNANKENHPPLNHTQPYYKKSPDYIILLQLIKEIKPNINSTPITDKLFSFTDNILYCYNLISTSLKPKQQLNLKFLNSIKFKLHETINSFISTCLSINKTNRKHMSISKGLSFSINKLQRLKNNNSYASSEYLHEELSNENIIEKIKQKIKREQNKQNIYSYGISRNSGKKNYKIYNDMLNNKKKISLSSVNKVTFGNKYKQSIRNHNNINPFLYPANTDYTFNHRIILEQDEHEQKKSNHNPKHNYKKLNPFKVCLTEADYSTPYEYKSNTIPIRDYRQISNNNLVNGYDPYKRNKTKMNNSFQSKSFADSLRSSQYTFIDNLGSASANRYGNLSLPKASQFTNYLMNKYKDVVERYNYYKDIISDSGSSNKMSRSAGRQTINRNAFKLLNGGFQTY